MDRIQSASEFVNRIDETSSEEDLVEIIGRIDALEEDLDKLVKAKKAAMMTWLQANGQLVIGTVRYYLGKKTTVKALDVKSIFETLLRDTDMDTLVSCFSSNAWKYGTVREVLNDETKFNSLFETKVIMDLATGKPLKEIKCVDSRFIKQAKQPEAN